jgi:hypothetical protein
MNYYGLSVFLNKLRWSIATSDLHHLHLTMVKIILKFPRVRIQTLPAGLAMPWHSEDESPEKAVHADAMQAASTSICCWAAVAQLSLQHTVTLGFDYIGSLCRLPAVHAASAGLWLRESILPKQINCSMHFMQICGRSAKV